MEPLLLDTQLLLWTTFDSTRLSSAARDMLSDPGNTLFFSTISIWEVAIKFARRKPDFVIEPTVLHSLLLANGFAELQLTSDHALATIQLPPIHRDPFDRLLVAQSRVENMRLLTSDATLALYPGPILRV